MLNIGQIIGAGFTLTRERPLTVLSWAVIYFIMLVAISFASRPMLSEQLALSQNAGDPTRLLLATLPLYGTYLVFMLVLLVLWTATYRAIFRPGESSMAYLRIGLDEVRLFGLSALMAIAAFGLLIVWTILIAIVGAGAAAALTDQSVAPAFGVVPLVLIILFSLLIYAVILFFQVRLALAFPLTVKRERFVIGEGWRLSRGHFWALFASALVINIAFLVVSIIVAAIFGGEQLMAMLNMTANPQAFEQANEVALQRQLEGFSPFLMLSWLLNTVVGVFWQVSMAAGIATAAQQLSDDDVGELEAILS